MHPILKEAKALQEELTGWRRYLHERPEVEFDLTNTVAFVTDKLRAMGYEPQKVGKSGVVVLAGGKQPGKTYLLRADMDALPIRETSGLPFASQNGCMHGCGHDMHTSMLLGAAKLLKVHEDEICGTVKLLFQPNEEALEGAKDVLAAGVLENPKVDAALMLHVQTGLPLNAPAGLLISSNAGPMLAAADWFNITVQGRGGHGGNPQQTVDPLNAACHIYLALQAITSRETSPLDPAVVTVGMMQGGETNNAIPDTACLKGTIRSFGKGNRAFIKKRMEEIACGTAETFRAKAKVEFIRSCPALVLDAAVESQAEAACTAMVGPKGVVNLARLVGEANARNMGSEDFGYFSEHVPTGALFLATGCAADGHPYPNHHPSATFDDSVLYVGAAAYVQSALEWLKHN